METYRYFRNEIYITQRNKKTAHFTVEMDKEEGVTAQMKVSSKSCSGPLKCLRF